MTSNRWSGPASRFGCPPTGGWAARAVPASRRRSAPPLPRSSAWTRCWIFASASRLDGESLTAEEIETLLKATHGLALLRGKWVEVDPERLASTIDKFQAIERLSESGGGSVRRRDASARRAPRSTRTTPTRQPRNGRMSRRARGWRRRSMAAAVPKGSRASIPATVSRRRCGRIKRRGCAGSICSRNSASAPASPTTWGSARRSRSWRCCRRSPPRRRRRRACWWRPLRCSPTGRWRRPGSRRA